MTKKKKSEMQESVEVKETEQKEAPKKRPAKKKIVTGC